MPNICLRSAVRVRRLPLPRTRRLVASHLGDWAQDKATQQIALDVLRDRYLIEETVEDSELLLSSTTSFAVSL